ncbi:MAG: hypothetical protein JXR94_02490 [Candidatus Hydrogenedentes bacterium]|nr:hypothetical protein [Candidatus Hydrogenedentota bacterium]
MMKRIALMVWAGAALGMGLSAFAQAGAAGAAGATAKVGEELCTMAMVLEDSVDLAGLEHWRGVEHEMSSPSFISARYVPTVGAILTIPVGFYLTEQETPHREAASGTAEDLWEKNRAVASGPPPPPGSAWVESIELLMDGEGWPFSGEESIPYDAEMVAEFREAVVGALAQYGHRMTHVADSERILVIVEAPSPARVAAVSRTEHQVLTRPGHDGTVQMSVISREGRPDRRRRGEGDDEEEEEEALHVVAGGGPVGQLLSFWGGKGYGEPYGAAERWLIAVNKADVKAPMKAEDLEGRLQEIRY